MFAIPIHFCLAPKIHREIQACGRDTQSHGRPVIPCTLKVSAPIPACSTDLQNTQWRCFVVLISLLPHTSNLKTAATAQAEDIFQPSDNSPQPEVYDLRTALTAASYTLALFGQEEPVRRPYVSEICRRQVIGL